MITFTTKQGEVKEGKLVRQYGAFEGGMRYIVSADGIEYRLIQKDGKYVEYVA